MATESFEKDFIVTDKEAPLWEKALEVMEKRNPERITVKVERITGEAAAELFKGTSKNTPTESFS